MELHTLRQILVSFVSDPSKSWGQATDGNQNPVDITTGREVRVRQEQSDCNTARLQSQSYTYKQYDDFFRQCDQIEQQGHGTARFSGDPDNLPEEIPERTCYLCIKTFRSQSKDDEPVMCYHCNLDRLCPVLPGREIRAYWRRAEWWLSADGDIGDRNKVTFCWHHNRSHSNVGHQALNVKRDRQSVIHKMELWTADSSANRCYVVIFDLDADTIIYATTTNRYVDGPASHLNKNAAEAFDTKIIDFIVGMVPEWMLKIHSTDPCGRLTTVA